MPILITCPSCQTKLSVPDDSAGKQAKCSRCGTLMLIRPPVPAAMPAPPVAAVPPSALRPKPTAPPVAAPPPPQPQSTAPPAAAPKPRTKPSAPPHAPTAPAPAKPRRLSVVPAPEPAKPGPRLPVLSLEELDLPPRFRARIEKEVGTEEIVWLGRPNMQERLRQARLGPIFGIVLILLAPAALALLLIDTLPEARWVMWLFAIGLAVMLLAFGLPLLLLPLLVRKFSHYRPVYVLTRRRAIVFHNVMGISAKVWSFDPEALRDREVTVGDNGLGSIVMGYEEYKHQGRLRHKQKTYTSEDGKKKLVVSELKRVGAHTSHIPVGFLDVDNVAKVEELLRQTLKLPAPQGG